MWRSTTTDRAGKAVLYKQTNKQTNKRCSLEQQRPKHIGKFLLFAQMSVWNEEKARCCVGTDKEPPSMHHGVVGCQQQQTTNDQATGVHNHSSRRAAAALFVVARRRSKQLTKQPLSLLTCSYATTTTAAPTTRATKFARATLLVTDSGWVVHKCVHGSTHVPVCMYVCDGRACVLACASAL